MLPPGDYQLTFTHDKMRPMLVIRDAKSLRCVAFEQINSREDSGKGESALLVGTRAGQRVVYSLTIAELGESFIYDRALSRTAEEAQQIQSVPVLNAQR